MKTAILVDSVSGLSEETLNHPNIFEAKLNVNFPDHSTMLDTHDIDEINAYFDKVDTFDDLPSTSQPSFAQLYDIYDQIIDEGFQRVIVFALSSALSGTYSGFVTVADEYADRIESLVYDSKSAALISEEMALDVLAIIEDNPSTEAIESIIRHHQEHSSLYVVVDNLKNLQKGGRLSASSAAIGTLLRVKPLLTIDQEGKLVVFEKIRTSRKVMNHLIAMLKGAIEKYEGHVTIGFAYTDSSSQPIVEQIQTQLLLDYPELQTRFQVLSPVVSTHLGRGAYGVAILPHYK